MLIICVKKGLDSKNEGWDYEFTNKLVVIFFILAIVPYICFVGIRNIEENSALKFEEKIGIHVLVNSYGLSTNPEEAIAQMYKMNYDNFWTRKVDIVREIRKTSVFYRYFGNFVGVENEYSGEIKKTCEQLDDIIGKFENVYKLYWEELYEIVKKEIENNEQ